MPDNPKHGLASLDWTSAAGWCAALTGALVPVSVAGMGAASALLLMLGLASGLYARHWRALLRHPVVPPALLLFAWLGIGLAYGGTPLDEALRVLKKYRELLLLPLLLPFFLDPRWRRLGLRALFAAMLLTLALSYAKAVALRLAAEPGADMDAIVFQHRITHNVFMALFAFWTALRAARPGPRRGLWLLLLALILVDMFVLVGGRTGQVALLALGGLYLFNRYRWRGLAASLLGAVLLGLALFYSAGIFHQRMSEIADGMARYQSGDYTVSTAQRLSFYRNALEIAAQRPLLGYGIGGFGPAYQAHIAGTDYPYTGNAHNEYLMLMVQGGLVALALFLLLLWRHWRCAGTLEDPEQRLLAQAVVVVMAVGCLLNSFLMDNPEAHAYAYLSALLLAPRAAVPAAT